MSPSERDLKNSALPLAYALDLLSQFIPIPVHVFKEDGQYLEKFNAGAADDSNVLKTDPAFRAAIIDAVRADGVTIISGEKPILYGGVRVLNGLTVVAGPVSMSDIDQNFCRLYALKHHARTAAPLRCDPRQLAALILLIYSTVSGRFIYLSDFLDHHFLDRDVIATTQRQIAAVTSERSLSGRPHNPGSFEEHIRLAIRAGDVDALKRALNSMYASMRGTLARTELRSAKNLAIVDITLATREAIAAGLGVEEMYVIADAFILQAEEGRSPSEVQALARACALRCAQMVGGYLKEQKNRSVLSPIVSRACDYIERHVGDSLDMDSICLKLKVSPSYLSKLFKAEKKLTIGEFVRERRVSAAKLLLATTDRSLAEIASSLKFNSQSHFGRVFVKQTGCTPSKYRSLYSIRDNPD